MLSLVPLTRHKPRLPISAATMAYLALALVGLIAYAGVLVQQVTYGLEFDESYNLTVVRNMSKGHGYASNSALFPGLAYKAFDPFVSTGPVVLMPTALLWRLSDGSLWAIRLVPLGFFALYLVACWVVGRRISGRWGGLVAVLAPLGLATAVPDLTTASLMPGRVVGEIPACALVLAGCAALVSGRPFLGGLCLGLAIEAKASFLLPVAALLAVWVVGSAWPNRPVDRRATARALVGSAIPPVAFELFRLQQLGPQDYVTNVREFLSFLGEQSGPVADRGARLRSLIDALAPWAWLFLLVPLALLIVRCAMHLSRHTGSGLPSKPATPGAAKNFLVAVPATVLLATWLGVSVQPSVRQGLPFLLLVLPLLFAIAAGTAASVKRGATRETQFRQRLLDIITAAGVVLLGVGVAISSLTVWHDGFGRKLAAEQRLAADAVLHSGSHSLPVDGWWQQPEMQVLTGLKPSAALGASPASVLVFTSVQALLDASHADARLYLGHCSEVLYASETAVVCRAA